MPEGDGQVASAEVDGFRVETNSGATSEEILRSIADRHLGGDEKDEKAGEKTEEEKRSEAGAELGKAGGKASAEKRAAEAEKEEKSAPRAEGDGPSSAADSAPEEKAKPGPDEKTDEEKDKPTGKPRHDAKARMLEATRKEAEAKRALAAERDRNDRLESRLDALERGDKPAPKTSVTEDDPKPSAKDFENNPEGYLDARDAWNERRLKKEFAEESHKRDSVDAVDRELYAVAQNWKKVTTESSLLNGGLDDPRLSAEVLDLKTEFQLPDGQPPDGRNWIANELVFSPEHAPALLLYFSEHSDELQRIAALSSPRAVSRALAKLEARLDAATPGTPSSKPEKEVSKAAPPVKPVSGTPYVAEGGQEVRPGESFDQWASRQKKIS